MKEAPIISVLLPVYNGGAYLEEAIESILNQTFTRFEFIMIDDGSTDSSLQVMQRYAKKDPRIRLVTRENRGLVSTLNELVDMATGLWVARMDSDDISLPARFERQLAWLEETGADICGSWVRRFGSSDRRTVRFRHTDEAIKTEMLFCSPFAHPTVIMRTVLVRQFHYNEAAAKAEDYELWVRGAEAGWKMSNVPEILLLYRTHQGQVSVQAAEFQQEQGRIIRYRYWHFLFAKMGLEAKRLDECLEIFNSSAVDVDMDSVDSVFGTLLRDSSDESRGIIFTHLTRLYIFVAANCPDVVSRWDSLNREFGYVGGIRTKLKLLLFQKLRIREGDRLFRWLKKIHVWRTAQ